MQTVARVICPASIACLAMLAGCGDGKGNKRPVDVSPGGLVDGAVRIHLQVREQYDFEFFVLGGRVSSVAYNSDSRPVLESGAPTSIVASRVTGGTRGFLPITVNAKRDAQIQFDLEFDPARWGNPGDASEIAVGFEIDCMTPEEETPFTLSVFDTLLYTN